MNPEIGPETVLGKRFRLTSQRERGWRGSFYAAADTERSDLQVDIEVMRAAGRQEEQYERLVRREVDIGDWLQDVPSVLRALAWGREESGWIWVAREWVVGAKPFEVKTGTLDEKVWRVLEAAQTVAALSDHGIVHRDLGAQSLLIVEGGIRLARFGLAKLDEVSDAWAGPAGLPFLHLRCVAPEAYDRPGGVDERADVYALGVLLYRALCGRWPFPGPSMPQLVGQQLRVQLGKAKITKPSERKPVAEALDSICLDALQPDPGRRTKTLKEFIDRLEGYLSVSGSGLVERPSPATPTASPASTPPVVKPGIELAGLDFDSEALQRPTPAEPDNGHEPESLDLGSLDLGGSGELLGGLDLTTEPPPPDPEPAPAPSPAASEPTFDEDFGSTDEGELVAVELSDDPATDENDPFAGDDFLAAASESDVSEDPFAGSEAGVEIREYERSGAATSNPFGAGQLEREGTDEFSVVLAPPSASAEPGGVPSMPAMPEISDEELLPPSAFDEFEVERGTLLASIDPEEFVELVENLNQLDPKGLSYLLLDMTQVENLGTSELEALTQVKHVARRRKLQAGMFGVTRGVRHVLQLMDMSEQVPFLLSADDRKDALMEIASLG